MSKFDLFFIIVEIVYSFILVYNRHYDRANHALLIVVVYLLLMILRKIKG